MDKRTLFGLLEQKDEEEERETLSELWDSLTDWLNDPYPKICPVKGFDLNDCAICLAVFDALHKGQCPCPTLGLQEAERGCQEFVDFLENNFSF